MKTLFGEREKKIARSVENSSSPISQIARQLFAMAQKKTEANLVSNLRDERYQRTFTDEYPFARKPQPRFRKVDEEQKSWWQKLAARNGPAQKPGFKSYTEDELRQIYARNTAEPTSEAAE